MNVFEDERIPIHPAKNAATTFVAGFDLEVFPARCSLVEAL
jgi:hypothetical protein